MYIRLGAGHSCPKLTWCACEYGAWPGSKPLPRRPSSDEVPSCDGAPADLMLSALYMVARRSWLDRAESMLLGPIHPARFCGSRLNHHDTGGPVLCS